MAQHNLRRSLAAFAFVTFATLSPLSDLSAAQVRQGRPEAGNVARAEEDGFSIWRPIARLLAKYGVRIDGNGLKYGVRIDGNGHRLHVDTEADGEKYGVRIDGNG
jgi:hypothetical protein